jgi:hypothetical protein
MGCVFCGIVQGTEPAEVIDEDDATVSFLDIAPFTRGHTLVIPVRTPRTCGPRTNRRQLPSCAPPTGWRPCCGTGCVPTGSTCCRRREPSPSRPSSTCTST